MAFPPWHFTIPGRLRGSKNRMTIVTIKSKRTGKSFHKLVPEKEHKLWMKAALVYLKGQWKNRPPIDEDCVFSGRIYVEPVQRVDLGNAMNAICDALQQAGVVTNDRRIRAYRNVVMITERGNPRVEGCLEMWHPAHALELPL